MKNLSRMLKTIKKFVSKPSFVSPKIFNKNLTAVHRIEKVLTLKKPAYAGLCILNLRNTLMYDFHYNYIKEKYDQKANLLFTDTDSLLYEIETNVVYEDFQMNKVMLDFSEYPDNSRF